MWASGRILAIQEHRFRLLTDDGQVYLLTLGRDAAVDASTLAQLQQRSAHVSVQFTGQPNLSDGVARLVQEDAAHVAGQQL